MKKTQILFLLMLHLVSPKADACSCFSTASSFIETILVDQRLAALNKTAFDPLVVLAKVTDHAGTTMELEILEVLTGTLVGSSLVVEGAHSRGDGSCRALAADFKKGSQYVFYLSSDLPPNSGWQILEMCGVYALAVTQAGGKVEASGPIDSASTSTLGMADLKTLIADEIARHSVDTNTLKRFRLDCTARHRILYGINIYDLHQEQKFSLPLDMESLSLPAMKPADTSKYPVKLVDFLKNHQMTLYGSLNNNQADENSSDVLSRRIEIALTLLRAQDKVRVGNTSFHLVDLAGSPGATKWIGKTVVESHVGDAITIGAELFQGMLGVDCVLAEK